MNIADLANRETISRNQLRFHAGKLFPSAHKTKNILMHILRKQNAGISVSSRTGG
jgi:hypothetical protein